MSPPSWAGADLVPATALTSTTSTDGPDALRPRVVRAVRRAVPAPGARAPARCARHPRAASPAGASRSRRRAASSVGSAQHAGEAPRSTSTVASTAPPSATRRQCWWGTSAYQTAPSASRQMPSGAAPSPSSAQVRRSRSEPSSAMVNAVNRAACDSATTNVEPSGVTAMPLGNQRSSATCRVSPSGSTTATMPGRGSSPGIEPGMSTYTRPAGSTTISFHGRPVPPYGARSGPTTTPCAVAYTSRPSGSQSTENGSPSMRRTTSVRPSASTVSTSPASQSHSHSRSSCHRGDSPIANPLASTRAVMPYRPPCRHGLIAGCRRGRRRGRPGRRSSGAMTSSASIVNPASRSQPAILPGRR